MRKHKEFNAKIATFILASTIAQTTALGADIASVRLPSSIYYGDKTIEVKSQRIINALNATGKITVPTQTKAYIQTSLPRVENANSEISNLKNTVKNITSNDDAEPVEIKTGEVKMLRYAGPIEPVNEPELIKVKAEEIKVMRYAGPIEQKVEPEMIKVEADTIKVMRYAGPIEQKVEPEMIKVEADTIKVMRYAGPIRPAAEPELIKLEADTIKVMRYAGPIRPAVEPQMIKMEAGEVKMLRYAGPIAPTVQPVEFQPGVGIESNGPAIIKNSRPL